jgi:hypothetical protein
MACSYKSCRRLHLVINADEILREVKANQAKLPSCARPDFSLPLDRRTQQPLSQPAISW